MEEVYLDNSATTKPSTKVVDNINFSLNEMWGNPSSKHERGIKVRELIESSRSTVADFLGCETDEIIFTSGACESNSLAIMGKIKDFRNKRQKFRFITTAIEHKSIELLVNDLEEGFPIVSVDKRGFVDLGVLDNLCKKTKDENVIPFVSIQWANNEIGTIQPMDKISEIVHCYGGILHTDATQIIPERRIDVKETNIDLLSFSGQKINCCKGIGVLYKSKNVNIKPLIYGSQENGLRGGTENTHGIYALRIAIKELETFSKDYFFNEIPTSDYFVSEVLERIPNTYLVGEDLSGDRLKNNVAICFKGIEANTIVSMLSDKGIYCSTGSACNSDSITPSYVLKAIGIPEEDIYSVVRFSFNSVYNYTHGYSKSSLDKVVDELENISLLASYGTSDCTL